MRDLGLGLGLGFGLGSGADLLSLPTAKTTMMIGDRDDHDHTAGGGRNTCTSSMPGHVDSVGYASLSGQGLGQGMGQGLGQGMGQGLGQGLVQGKGRLNSHHHPHPISGIYNANTQVVVWDCSALVQPLLPTATIVTAAASSGDSSDSGNGSGSGSVDGDGRVLLPSSSTLLSQQQPWLFDFEVLIKGGDL